MPYRLEYGKRVAKCKGPKPCAGSPIVKGSLRLGTVVEIMGRSGFVWRHWGCTTAKVLGNLKEDAPDPDDLDGWEDLTDEDKARITAAYASGAVAPEDIPETARKPEGEGDDDDDEKPKKKRAPKKKAPKKSKGSDDEDDADEAKPKKAPVKKASGSKKPKNESDASEEEAEALSTDDEKPKKKAAAAKRKAQDSDDDGAPPPARAPSARSRGPVKNLKESDGSDPEEDEKPKKSSAKKARKSNATVDSEDDE